MKPNPWVDTVVAVLALIAALAAAYWLDYAVYLAIERARATFDYTLVNWLPGATQLLLGAGLATLVWWLMTRATFPWVIDVIYALTGVAAVLTFPLIFALQLSVTFLGIFSGPVSLWTTTGSVLAAAGICHLIRRRPVADQP